MRGEDIAMALPAPASWSTPFVVQLPHQVPWIPLSLNLSILLGNLVGFAICWPLNAFHHYSNCPQCFTGTCTHHWKELHMSVCPTPPRCSEILLFLQPHVLTACVTCTFLPSLSARVPLHWPFLLPDSSPFPTLTTMSWL